MPTTLWLCETESNERPHSGEGLRDGAGEPQVPGAETALVHGNGGVFFSEVTAILRARH